MSHSKKIVFTTSGSLATFTFAGVLRFWYGKSHFLFGNSESERGIGMSYQVIRVSFVGSRLQRDNSEALVRRQRIQDAVSRPRRSRYRSASGLSFSVSW